MAFATENKLLSLENREAEELTATSPIANSSGGVGNELNLNEYSKSFFQNLKFIENKNYFLVNPLHGNNDGSDLNTGTCTTVAMQLLIGYHNYYSDRRLIPETSKDGTRFLSENYGGFESEPSIHYKGIPYEYNYLGDPRIGTEEGLYKELFSENQTIFNIATIANQFVLNYASEIKTNVSIDAYLGSSTATAIASIDAGHPIILGYNGISGTKTFHVVVAYGYATVYGEMGFIVHYGHDDDKTQIWVPASWFGFQIRMTVAHEHEYELEYQQSDKFFEDTDTEFHCVSCKHKKYDKLFTVNESGETITGLRYPHITWLKIPTIYNGNYITKIGDGAFAHSDIGLVAFDFNSNITTIGNRAFEDCKSLNLANIPDKVTSIGNYAFAGIDSLLIKFSNPSLQTIGHNAFFETALVMSEFPASVKKIDNKAFCKSDLGTDFLLPANSQLTTIDYSAFDTNLRLKYFLLPKTISSIAKNAFQNCPSISFYTENSSKPTGWNEEWNLSRPVIWGCTLSSDKSYVVSFTKTNMNPSNANAQNGIFNPIRKDYTFGGWYTSLNFSGTQYMDIKSAPNGTLFAKWEQKSCVAEGTLITCGRDSKSCRRFNGRRTTSCLEFFYRYIRHCSDSVY